VSSGQDPVFADKGTGAKETAINVETHLVGKLSFFSGLAAENSRFTISNGLPKYWDSEFVS